MLLLLLAGRLHLRAHHSCLLRCLPVRWQTDVFAADKVLIPMHVDGNHWCLAVINLRDKRFEYYDSMFGAPDCLQVSDPSRLSLPDLPVHACIQACSPP